MKMKSCLLSLSLFTAALAQSGCSTFALSYQNYFTKNFAYVSTGYDGNPGVQLADGAESNNIENGNEKEYSAAEHPTIFFGFRTLEHHNSQYTRGSNMDEVIHGTLVPPGKSEAEAVQFVTLTMSGSNINAKLAIPQQASTVTFIKASYPALMVKVDNKAMQAAYGSGPYTIVWTSVKSDGKEENRELSRVVTELVP